MSYWFIAIISFLAGYGVARIRADFELMKITRAHQELQLAIAKDQLKRTEDLDGLP